MSATTFEGVVEGGRIKLETDIHIPEGTRVYVVVPGVEVKETGLHLYSPRLRRREDVVEFEMDVRES